MTLGILTCDGFPELLPSDQKLIPLLASYNIIAKPVVWDDQTVDWTDFDYLLFRNTWDYYEKETAFNHWLLALENMGVRTLNPVAVIQQNKHKFYLQELERQGISLLPTVFVSKRPELNLTDLIPEHWQKIVIKPAFSAGSYLTRLFDRSEMEVVGQEYAGHVFEKDFLLQEFEPKVKESGEISFIFFNGIFSHAVRKKPKNGDFRVQIQYGGQYTPIEPDTNLIAQARHIVSLIPGKLLYARVDGIVIEAQLRLMEIELIEPDLYFDLAAGSRERFVRALLELIP